MARTANVIIQVESEIKERAEAVLDQLGISMSTAMTIYLKQIALLGRIPFEISSATNAPIVLGNLSGKEFNEAMDKAVMSYEDGLCTDISDFKKELNK